MKESFQSHLSKAKLKSLLAKKRPLKIGLTGGIGAGKSSALKFLEEKKIPILQTDLLGHQLLKDRKIITRLVKTFGNDILGTDKAIDRKKLAQAAFRSSRQQKKLNEIMHPAVRQGVAKWMRDQSKFSSPPSFVIVEVPLMFERGLYRVFDAIVSISANDKTRKKRLKQRGWSLTEIRQRESLQWSQKEKDQRSDWVIYNQSTEKSLKYALYEWMEPFLHL